MHLSAHCLLSVRSVIANTYYLKEHINKLYNPDKKVNRGRAAIIDCSSQEFVGIE